MVDHVLGEVVSRHRVDNNRRGTVAITGLIIGVAATAAAVPLIIAAFDYQPGDGPSRGLFPGLVGGLGLVGLWLAASNGFRYLFRRDEEFVVREKGLVHSGAGREKTVPWHNIRTIRDDSRSYGRVFGWDTHVRIHVQDGPNILITGFAERADRLAKAVKRRTPTR